MLSEIHLLRLSALLLRLLGNRSAGMHRVLIATVGVGRCSGRVGARLSRHLARVRAMAGKRQRLPVSRLFPLSPSVVIDDFRRRRAGGVVW